jgi:hypothetical protein
MSTDYSLSSGFSVKKDVDMDALKRVLAEMDELIGERLCVLNDNRVELEVSDNMGYSRANNLDELWIRMVKEFADLSEAVCCTSDGDDYPDGPIEWYVGERNAVIQQMKHDIHSKIHALEEELDGVEINLSPGDIVATGH